MLWYTRSNRTLDRREENAIATNQVRPEVFVKRDDTDGGDFYYLGRATAADANDSQMVDSDGNEIPVVTMHLELETPVAASLYEYLSGTHAD